MSDLTIGAIGFGVLLVLIALRVPVAVKLAPLFTAFAHFAGQVDAAGADGLILFNRFHRADIDVVELEVVRSLELSDSSELQLRLRGVAVLAGRVKASLAITGGVLCASDDACDARFFARAELKRVPLTDGLLPVLDKAWARRG